MDRSKFLEVISQHLAAQGLPVELHGRVYEKVANDIYDAGEVFELAEIADDDDGDDEGGAAAAAPTTPKFKRMQLLAKRDIAPMCDVWLVDHAWTFRIRELKKQLRENGALRQRMAGIVGYTGEAGDDLSVDDIEKAIEAIHSRLPRFVDSYRLATEEKIDIESCWYVKDEVGSGICCNTAGPAEGADDLADAPDAPNLAWCLLPAVLPDKPYSLTLVWPIAQLEEGDFCRADPMIVPRAGLGERQQLIKRLLYWEDEAERIEAEERCIAAFEALDAAIAAKKEKVYVPSTTAQPAPVITTATPATPIAFYTDSALVSHSVTDPHYFQVAAPETAQVMWLSHYSMTKTDEFPHATFVSQFPEERFWTNKWHLARTVRDAVGRVQWFNDTYDGVTELVEFAGAFLKRQRDIEAQRAAGKKRVDDNLFIVKPHNLARSMDMYISDDLPWLLSMAATGQKIFSKYISHPATFRGRKFDLRFVVVLRSLPTPDATRNLELFVYDVFWTRFGTEQYGLHSFDSYEHHFTVHNYRDPAKILEVKYSDFITEFDAQYAPAFAGRVAEGKSVWAEHVVPKIQHMLRQIFALQNTDDVSHDRFRGMYGVDLMLRERYDEVDGAAGTAAEQLHLDPAVLEITYSPDCKRAVRDYPHFFSDIFNCLFRGEVANMKPL